MNAIRVFSPMTERSQAASGAPRPWRFMAMALDSTMRSFVLLLCLVPVFAVGQTQPGDTNPLGPFRPNALLFDHELFWLHLPISGEQPYPGVSYNFLEYCTGQTGCVPQANYVNDFNWADVDHGSSPLESHQMFAANGRPLQPGKDHVVIAQRASADPSTNANILLRFFPIVGPSGEPHSESDYTLTGANLAPRVADPSDSSFYGSDFLDVAMGDLNRMLDGNGFFHDEVAIAWMSLESGQYVPHLAVLDYTDPAIVSPPPSPADASHPAAVTTAEAQARLSQTSLTGGSVYVNDNVLSLAVGDFDGDGRKEIALAVIESSTEIFVEIFRYSNDGAGNRSLTAVSSIVVAPPGDQRFTATVDLAAANLDGDPAGQDELLLGHVYRDTSTGTSHQVYLRVFQADPSLTVSQINITTASGGTLPVSAAKHRPKVQLVPGLFDYDPPRGHDFNSRQVAVVYNYFEPTDNQDHVRGLILANPDLALVGPGYLPMHTGDPGQRWTAAAGAFRGIKDDDPTWSLMLATWDDGGWFFRYIVQVWEGPLLENWTLPSNPPVSKFVVNHTPNNPPFDSSARLPLVATDWDGDSVVLGPPYHLTSDEVTRTEVVLQEPPKHTYWDGSEVVNLTRIDTFNVTLRDEQGKDFKYSDTTTGNWNVGASGSFSFFDTVRAGKNRGLVQGDIGEGSHITIAADAAFTHASESINSKYVEGGSEREGDTTGDDWLAGTLEHYDIWRYPIYSGEIITDHNTGKPAATAYYDYVVPGSSQSQTPFDGSGGNFDWYQPPHENGNVLSYPRYLNPDPEAPSQVPTDLGSVTVTDPSSGNSQTVEALLFSDTMKFADATEGSQELKFTGTFQNGTTVSSEGSLDASLDIAVTFTVKEEVGAEVLVEEQARLTLRGMLALQGGGAWGNTTNKEHQTTLSTGISLNRDSFDNQHAYAFYPTFYYTEDGTLKVAHAVDVLASAAGRGFWESTYGGSWDAALNLPLRFQASYECCPETLTGWEVSELTSRKQIRGFFLTETEPSFDGQYLPLSDPPANGEEVRIAVRVYNYTTGNQQIVGLPVRFEAVPHNSDDSDGTWPGNCPDGQPPNSAGRCVLGSTSVDIPSEDTPLQMWTWASILWNTKDFGPGQSGASADYRIYVVLDPDDVIPGEKYETEPAGCDFDDPSKPACDPGQNNEGWGLATVATPDAGASQAAAPAPDPDLSLGVDSFAARSASGTFLTGKVKVPFNHTVPLRVSVHSDRFHPFHRWLLVYDGKPGKKGSETIAMKRVRGLNRGADSHVWFDWRPRKPGRHDLHAVVLEPGGDPVRGNNVARLSVLVTP